MFDWDQSARPVSRTTTGGPAYAFGYDPSGRPDSLEITRGAESLASFELSYDEGGNVTSKDSFVAGAPASENGTWSYAYDGPGRMIEATDPLGVPTLYGYDGAGNRTSVQVGSATAVTTSYQHGLPTSSSDGTSYGHDGAGNLTAVAGGGRDLRYTYDDWGRLTGVKTGAGLPISSSTHDALGREVTRAQGAATAALSYVGLSEDLAQEAGVVTTSYAHSPLGPLAQRSPLGVRFHLTDLHGDVVGLAASASLATQPLLAGLSTYGPWGEPRESSGEESRLGFQGDATDPATGLVDMGARLYDPLMGRFTQPDPLFGDPMMPTSLNRYVYGVDNPLTFADPTGLCSQTPGMGDPCEQNVFTGTRKSRSENIQEHYSGGAPLDTVDAGYVPPPPAPPPVIPTDPKITTTAPILWMVPQDERAPQPSLEGFGDSVMDIGQRTFHIGRFAVNGPLTLGSFAWARANGGRCSLERGLIVVCTAVRRWANGPRQALTVGNTIISEIRVDSELLSHEEKHASHWLIPGFPVLYTLSEGLSQAAGRDSCWNIFEIHAGREAGGYHC